MLGSSLVLVAGLMLLAWASDQFVIGAARLSVLSRVSPVVIGVVVVGFGTSAPEALVSALAALDDEPAIAVGNVVGSNLVNLTLLLGVGALLTPIVVGSGVVRREAPITVGATVVFALAVQGGLGRGEGVLLLLALAAAVAVVLRSGRGDPLGAEAEEFAEADASGAAPSWTTELGRTGLGLLGTVAGAQLLLTGALDLADRAGLASGLVGATIVAGGTSLPELVTVVQSARKRETDLIVGNLLGSNLINALGVAGLAGVLGPAALDAPELTTVATIAALVTTALAWAVMVSGRRVSRAEGGVLVGIYAVAIVTVGA